MGSANAFSHCVTRLLYFAADFGLFLAVLGPFWACYAGNKDILGYIICIVFPGALSPHFIFSSPPPSHGENGIPMAIDGQEPDGCQLLSEKWSKQSCQLGSDLVLVEQI